MNQRHRMRNTYKGPRFKESELWGLGTVLARIIAAGVQQYIHYCEKKQARGYSDSYPVKAGSMERWKAIREEIAWAFHEIAEDRKNSPADRFRRSRENPGEIPAEIEAKEKEYEERIQNGLRLFAEYIENFWD